MINALIELSAKNRFVVFLLVAVATVAGVWSMKTVPIDAIPDLSDTQVIVYSRWDRSPDIVEDQVTYPIVTKMLGAPKVKAVRGFSDFGFSYVYIVFEEGTDIYWARSRTLESSRASVTARAAIPRASSVSRAATARCEVWNAEWSGSCIGNVRSPRCTGGNAANRAFTPSSPAASTANPPRWIDHSAPGTASSARSTARASSGDGSQSSSVRG